MNLSKIIRDLYEEYQAYMNIEYMEEYKLEIRPIREMGCTIAETIKKDKIRYLVLNDVFAKDLLSSKGIERWKIGILFHEFTHIADDKVFEMNNVPQSKKYIYRPYTEYHAEFVKTLYMFEMPPFCDDRVRITYTEKINSQYGYVSIYEYISKLKEGYTDDININKMDDMLSYISCFDKLSYYLGAASVYRICCDYDIDRIMDISSFTEKLGGVSEKIRDILLKTVNIRFDTKAAIECAQIYIPLIQPFFNN